MLKIRHLLLCLLLVVVSVANAQSRKVTGQVTSDSDGEPMPGVTIQVKGVDGGAISDNEGNYSISVNGSDAILIFSFIGMETKEVTIGTATKIDVELTSSALNMDEVIVVGYGTAKKSQFVGSAKAIKGELLTSKSSSNVGNSLQGTAAGVQVVNGSGQPGSSATIRIRGVGSINGGTKPLYIVDGSPYEFNLNSINPHDIQSITVLKDAASTAIYGARGANGVVLITTKSGDRGGKAKVSVETKWGVSSRGVPNYNVMTDPAMYYETAYKALYNSQVYNGISESEAIAYADANFLSQSGVGYQIYSVPNGQKLIGTNFKLNPNASLGYSDGDYYYTPDDWSKETLNENSLRQEYNISIQGGKDKNQYFISAGFLDDPGIISGSGFNRYTLRGKIDTQAKKWLKIGLSTAYVNSTVESPSYQTSWGSTGNVFYASNMMAPIYPFYVRNANGTNAFDNNGWQIYDQGTSTNFTRPGNAPRGNQAINLLLDTDQTVFDYFSSNFYAKVTPIKGLNITAQVTPNISNSRSNFLSNPFYGSPSTQGLASVSSERFFSINQQYLAEYISSFSDLHNFKVLAGYEQFQLKDQSLSGSNDYLYSPFIAELSNAYGTQPTSANVSSNTENFATEGYVGRVQYDYSERYFLSASARYEGSSRFSADNRWGLFGSVGAAWLISSEDFMNSTSSWLDKLKYKISYGTQGNDQIGTYYAYRNLYDIAYNSTTGEFTKVLSTKGNEDLTWESQILFNTGIEFSLFDNILTGSIDYFSRENSAMLFNEPQPVSSGIESIPKNAGSVVNNGLEIDLSAEVLKTEDITWSVFANATYINSEIKSLPAYTKADGGIKYSSYILKEGGSLNQAYMVEYAGIDKSTGEALYYVDPDNGDYSTTVTYADAQQTDLGDISVDWYGGFGTNLNAFNFDLSVQFAYQLGGKAYDGSYQELMHTGKQIGRNWHADILDAWTPTNTNTDIPRISSSDDIDQKNSSRFLVSSNYLSLNNISLGYTLPKTISKKLNIEKCRVYISGDNLALLTARKGFDPRQSQNSRATGVALSTSSGNYVYSQLRVLAGGLSITF